MTKIASLEEEIARLAIGASELKPRVSQKVSYIEDRNRIPEAARSGTSIPKVKFESTDTPQYTSPSTNHESGMRYQRRTTNLNSKVYYRDRSWQ